MRATNRQLDSRRPEGGWHHIAWAFLKVRVYCHVGYYMCLLCYGVCIQYAGAFLFSKPVG